MKFTKPIILLAILAFVITSCTRTVEGEKKRWSNNLAKIDLLSQKYPTFKTILSEVKSAAEHEFATALTTQDEEERIEKMTQANRSLNPPFVRDLNALESKAKEAKDLNKKILELSTDETTALVAAISGMNLEQMISNIKAGLRGSEPVTIAAANTIVRDAMKPLNDHIKEMKKVVMEMKKMQEPATPEQ
jgi:ribosome-binding ATPase YchF (GTP1/OBG family)